MKQLPLSEGVRCLLIFSLSTGIGFGQQKSARRLGSRFDTERTVGQIDKIFHTFGVQEDVRFAELWGRSDQDPAASGCCPLFEGGLSVRQPLWIAHKINPPVLRRYLTRLY